MEVNLELKPIKWSRVGSSESYFSQGILFCDKDQILLYTIDGYEQNLKAECHLTSCIELDRKYKLSDRHSFEPDSFKTMEEATKACEAHYRELMLKAFLQPV